LALKLKEKEEELQKASSARTEVAHLSARAIASKKILEEEHSSLLRDKDALTMYLSEVL